MQRIFAADIGGTNARFALFSVHQDDISLARVAWGRSTELDGAASMLSCMQNLLQTPIAAGDALSVALAGPIKGLRGKLTNGALRLDLGTAVQPHALSHCLLLNDFAAQAYATLTPAGRGARLVRGREPDGAAWETRAVLGPGTGLGSASLVRCGAGRDGRWLAVPSEAGHTFFPFMTRAERAYGDFLARSLGHEHITAENVLSGAGLSLLHRFLCGRELAAPQVGAEALSRETPTLEWYSRFLGRYCRQWICSTLCRGGLWIAGGIAAGNPLCVLHPAFAHEFERASDIDGVVAATPVLLVTDVNSGLWGAARAVCDLARPGETPPAHPVADGRPN